MTISETLSAEDGLDDFGKIDEVVPDPWPGAVVALVDATAILCATVLAGLVLSDATSMVRAITSVGFFLVVPGWALLRGLRARPCSMTLMAAVASSISMTLIEGEVMVTRLGFPWRGATILACGLSAMVLLVDLGARRWQ